MRTSPVFLSSAITPRQRNNVVVHTHQAVYRDQTQSPVNFGRTSKRARIFFIIFGLGGAVLYGYGEFPPFRHVIDTIWRGMNSVSQPDGRTAGRMQDLEQTLKDAPKGVKHVKEASEK